MPTLDLDFGDVGKVIPEGCWRVLIKEVVYKLNKAKDGYILEFDAETMDMPEEHSAFEGTKIFPKPNASLKPTARWKLQEVLSAITQEDWTQDGMQLEVDDSDEDHITVPMLEGKTVLGIFVHEPYQNRVSVKMDTWIADNGEVSIGATSPQPGGSAV